MIKDTPLSNMLLKSLRDGNHFAPIYYHIFSCMGIQQLEYSLEYIFKVREGIDEYWKEDGKNDWFRIFHKSVRQTDFFDDMFREKEIEILSEKDYSRFQFLKNIVHKNGFVKYSKAKTETFVPEYREYLKLHEIWRQRKITISLGGHMDMILWNTIHEDNNFLYNSMSYIFDDFKFLNKAKLNK